MNNQAADRRRVYAVLLAAVGVSLGLAAVALKVAPVRGHPGDLSFIPVLIPMLALAGVGLLLSLRLPSNAVGWLVSASQISFTLLLLGVNYSDRVAAAHDLPSWPLVPVPFLTTFGWSAGFPFLLVLLPLVFPDGHVVSRRWRIAVWLGAATIVFTTVTSMLAGFFSGPGLTVANATGPALVFGILDGPVAGVFMLALMVAAIVSLVIRYRRAGSELRHQLKWFLAAMATAVLAVIPELAGVNSNLAGAALTIGLTVVPVGIAISVLRYRLYDIDVIISRALVYGALAAFITVIYVAIVVGVGLLIGSGGKPNLALSIVATGVIAVGFQPVRERLQRLANRMVYGRRATPYEVLADFSGRVAESYAAEAVLPQMADVLRAGTGAEHATVWLRGGAELRPAATSPETVVGYEPLPLADGAMPVFPGATRSVPVLHGDELLGVLSVAKRAGESLTPIEEKLLEDLARQAGLVLKNVGLTSALEARLADLSASRQRLVAAQDEERRRLERNLHDGAQQHLVALKVKLGLAETIMERDAERATILVDELIADAGESLETLRDLARGIYPPLLAQAGLVEALESQARKATVPTTVDGTAISRYPEEIEAAVYFCVLEALQNVQKYAAATLAKVELVESGGTLSFTVRDNGQGFDVSLTSQGTGLTNMADRMDALGGTLNVTSRPGDGTSLQGIVPLLAAVPA